MYETGTLVCLTSRNFVGEWMSQERHKITSVDKMADENAEYFKEK